MWITLRTLGVGDYFLQNIRIDSWVLVSISLSTLRSRTTNFASMGQLPPARGLLVLTMYDAKTQHLVANPLPRYLLNSTTLKSYVYGPDGSFYAVLRVYLPGDAVINGSWKRPQMQPKPRN